MTGKDGVVEIDRGDLNEVELGEGSCQILDLLGGHLARVGIVGNEIQDLAGSGRPGEHVGSRRLLWFGFGPWSHIFTRAAPPDSCPSRSTGYPWPLNWPIYCKTPQR